MRACADSPENLRTGNSWDVRSTLTDVFNSDFSLFVACHFRTHLPRGGPSRSTSAGPKGSSEVLSVSVLWHDGKKSGGRTFVTVDIHVTHAGILLIWRHGSIARMLSTWQASLAIVCS